MKFYCRHLVLLLFCTFCFCWQKRLINLNWLKKLKRVENQTFLKPYFMPLIWIPNSEFQAHKMKGWICKFGTAKTGVENSPGLPLQITWNLFKPTRKMELEIGKNGYPAIIFFSKNSNEKVENLHKISLDFGRPLKKFEGKMCQNTWYNI